MDLKNIIEKAKFKIQEDIPFEGFLCVGKDFKAIDQKTAHPFLFSVNELVIDAVMLNLRPTPNHNVWRRRVNMEIVEYCHKMVPFRRMSFVIDQQENENAKIDFLICIFDERYVQRSSDYDTVYQQSIAKIAQC